MRHELVTPEQMADIDRRAIAEGPFHGYALMENAGRAVFREILARFPQVGHHAVLCGPGNNGGDGYVVARLLMETGLPVSVFAEGRPRSSTDAAHAAGRFNGPVQSLADFIPRPDWLVVDALYGGGLSRPLSAHAARCATLCREVGTTVVAVDIPSGIDGASGITLGDAFRADLTVTFVRRKSGHLLEPGRGHCGETIVADIGISDAHIASIGGETFENVPALWQKLLPRPSADTHKYRRGHCAVFSGGPASTGAARLAAEAAVRAGSGAVTVIAPADAVAANAAHLTSIMVREAASAGDALGFLGDRKVSSVVIGPGFGRGPSVAGLLLDLLNRTPADLGFVIDADAITAAASRRAEFFAATEHLRLRPVLTPHDGEFARLFPEIAENPVLSKLERARHAARTSHCVVVLKGPDTVIAAPDGRAAINANGTPYLATAGSGDVLAGLVGGLVAQGMPAWEASCAAVWVHAKAGNNLGAGMIADDLPGALVRVMQDLARSLAQSTSC